MQKDLEGEGGGGVIEWEKIEKTKFNKIVKIFL